jgi:hypothetical protein
MSCERNYRPFRPQEFVLWAVTRPSEAGLSERPAPWASGKGCAIRRLNVAVPILIVSTAMLQKPWHPSFTIAAIAIVHV